MEASSLSAVQIILIVLAANAVLVLLAYGLVTWWQKQSRGAVQEILSVIRI